MIEFRRLHLAGTALVLGLAPLACKAPPLPVNHGGADVFSQSVEQRLYGLGPGDVLAVVVFGHPELSTAERGSSVDRDGALRLPQVGAVPVDGLSTAEVERAITSALGRLLKDPQVAVQVVSRSARRIYLLGQVDQPGAYPIDRPLTALQAVALGGGFRRGARRGECALLRRQGQQWAVAFFNASTPGADGLITVEPEDLLYVPQSGTGVFADDILPILQGFTSLTSIVLVGEALTN